MVRVGLVPVLVICGLCSCRGSPGLVLAVRGSAEWIAHNTNVVSRTRLHKYIFRWIVAVLSWEQCPCTLTNLRPESVSLPANSAMHKHCVYEKLCLWTTNSTVQEGNYEINDSVCFCVRDFHFAKNQWTAVHTAHSGAHPPVLRQCGCGQTQPPCRGGPKWDPGTGLRKQQ